MKNLIKNEMILFFRKKNLITFAFACLSVLFIFNFYFEVNYQHYASDTVIQIKEEIKKAEVNSNAIENRLAGLKEAKAEQKIISETEVLLNHWQFEKEKANYERVLWDSGQIENNENEIRKTQIERDINALNTQVDEKMLLDYSGMYRTHHRDLLNREKIMNAYQQEDILIPINPRTPTGASILSEALSGFNPILLLILLCAIIWNSDMWSSEYDHNGFQLLFTLPYKKSSIYLVRTLLRILFTLLGAAFILLLLYGLGTLKYGSGLEQLLITNNQGINSMNLFDEHVESLLNTDFVSSIAQVILLKGLFTFLYLISFISFISVSSLLSKEKGLSVFVPSILMMITYLLVQTTTNVASLKFIPSCYLLTSNILTGGMGMSMLLATIVLMATSSLLNMVAIFNLTYKDLNGIR